MANIDIRTAGKEVQTSKGQMILGVNANDLVVINPEKLVETTNAFSNIKSDIGELKEDLNYKKIPLTVGAYDYNTGNIDTSISTYKSTDKIQSMFFGSWIKELFETEDNRNNFIILYNNNNIVGSYALGQYFASAPYETPALEYTPFFTHFSCSIYQYDENILKIGVKGNIFDSIVSYDSYNKIMNHGVLSFDIVGSVGEEDITKVYPIESRSSVLLRAMDNINVLINGINDETIYCQFTLDDDYTGGVYHISVVNNSPIQLNKGQWYRFTVNGNEHEDIEISITKRDRVILTAHNVDELFDAFETANRISNQLSKDYQCDIFVHEGIYNLYSKVDKSSLVSGDTIGHRGLELPDYCNLYGNRHVQFNMTVPESDNTEEHPYSLWLSTLNLHNGEHIIHNIEFVANNCRYCIHDDSGEGFYNKKVEFRHCRFIHEGMVSTLWHTAPDCYGSGWVSGRIGIFDNCIFEGNYLAGLYMHTHYRRLSGSPVKLEVNNCAFKSKGQKTTSDSIEGAILLQTPWDIDFTGDVSINNNYFVADSKIKCFGNYPMRVFGGGNSHVEIVNENGSEIYLINNN